MTSPSDITERELWSHLTGALAGQRCREIDRRLAVDAELAARVETLQRGHRTSWRRPIAMTATRVTSAKWWGRARSQQFRAPCDDIRAEPRRRVRWAEDRGDVGSVPRRGSGCALAGRIAQHLHADDPHTLLQLKQLGLEGTQRSVHPSLRTAAVLSDGQRSLHSSTTARNELRLDLHELILEIPFALIVSTTWDDSV